MSKAKKGLDRITEIVSKARSIISTGKTIKTDAEKTWTKINATYSKAKGVLDDIQKKFGDDTSIADKLLAAREIVTKSIEVKDDIMSIYKDAMDIKDKAVTIVDDAKFIINELQKWKDIKKEVEVQFNETKLEVLKAIETCRKLASKAYKDAEKELIAVREQIGKLNFSNINSDGAKKAVDAFKAVMDKYDWWTSGGESDVKKLKKSIAKNVTKSLESIVKDAIDYVAKSERWKQVEELVNEIIGLRNDISAIITKANNENKVKSLDLKSTLGGWADKATKWAGDKAGEVLGPLAKTVGPAFDTAKKLFAAYNMISGFPDTVKDQLPKTFDHTFFDKKYTFLDYKVTIPIASLGWITLTAGVGLKAEAAIKISGSVTIHNVFDVKELKIVSGDLKGTGYISLTGSAYVGLNLVGIVEATASANLEAKAEVKEAKAGLVIHRELQGDAKKGAVEFKANAELQFGVYGSLSFTVGLTAPIRVIIEFITGKSAQKNMVYG